MLETLVSSRIRRTLFEYILAHPSDRFYLRGLAKALGLSVSPLRRELKRLEHSGMLRALQEANVVFYTVDTTSPSFLQLRQAGLGAEDILQRSAQNVQAIPVGVISVSPRLSLWKSPLSSPALIGAAVVGMALVMTVAGLAYLTLTHQQAASTASRTVATRETKVTVVVPSTSASGTMHGARWHIVPGGFGGFSAGSNSESY